MSSPTDTQDTHTDAAAALALHGTRRQRFMRGARLGIPILLGYAPVGMAFGILARQGGFSTFEATVCSATAIAGAGQFIALSVLGSGAGAASALVATAVVNLRYLLFSTTLAPHVHSARPKTLAWLGFTLTDETFAVNVADLRQGTATLASMSGVGAIAWTGWVGGTFLGAAGSALIGDPARFGVGFAMPAMFSALFVALAEDRRHIVVGVVAGALCLLLPLAPALGLPELAGSWYVVISAIVAASVASAVWRDE